MIGRTAPRLLAALISAALSWVAICSWSRLVEAPDRYLGPAAVGMLLIAVTGALGRGLHARWYAVLPAQLVVVTVWFHHHLRLDDTAGGWLPTPHGLEAIAERIRTGAEQVNALGAPVPEIHHAVPVYLLAVALLVALAVDLIGCGLGRGPWTGLPLLIALAVPISVLDSALPWLVLAGTAVLFALLIAVLENEHAQAWGQGLGNPTAPGGPTLTAELAALPTALAVASLAVLGALVVPLVVPLGPGLFDRDGNRDSDQPSTLALTNPMVGLRRDLVGNDHLPLLTATTDAADASYLRLSVLDRFTGSAWVPGDRTSLSEVPAEGVLPSLVGVDSVTPTQDSEWVLSTTDVFRTNWLPIPLGTRSLSIDEGNWRYMASTADVVSASETAPIDVDYQVTARTPTITAAALAAAGPAPNEIRDPMTEIVQPRAEVTRIARQVTAGATSDYEKAVLLQRWFRSEGGFRYSLDPAAGDGMDQLVRFITVDKVGFCQQFAAAMAVMARSLGIPARVVVGFLDGERSSPQDYLYTSDDLHAWPEIYFSGSGWVRFEPTPSARTGSAPRWTRTATEPPSTATPTARPTPARQTPAPIAGPQERPTSKTTDTSWAVAPAIVVLALLFLLLLATPYLLRRRLRNQRLRPQTDGRAELAALWAELLATAVDLGVTWPVGRSLRVIATALSTHVGPDDADLSAWNRLIELGEQSRYRRDFSVDAATRDEAQETVLRWSALLAASVPARRARAAKVLPRSIFVRGGGESAQ